MKVFIVTHKSQNNTQAPWGRQGEGGRKTVHTQALTNHLKSKVLSAAKLNVTNNTREETPL